jgi:ParB/RepB/Spo0J family partition protein
MAKRKRLTPANPIYLDDTHSVPGPGFAGSGLRAPIADVASDAATSAALADVSNAFAQARVSGRMVALIPVDDIQLDYLVRDRLVVQDDDMAALVTSIRERGQQTPIEVVALGAGGYGLISGWRRCKALVQLAGEGVGDGQVKALLRQPETASDAYLAMVEENEIRVGLSYFERANIAVKSTEHGVFETQKKALNGLFGTASRAKRSKIGSFIPIVEALGDALRHPHMIGERMGLQLAKRLGADPGFASTLVAALAADVTASADVEQAVLARALADKGQALEAEPKKAEPPIFAERELCPGVMVRVDRTSGALQIWGDKVTPDLRARLMDWLRRQP